LAIDRDRCAESHSGILGATRREEPQTLGVLVGGVCIGLTTIDARKKQVEREQ
jgi:hypothetical protein